MSGDYTMNAIGCSMYEIEYFVESRFVNKDNRQFFIGMLKI